MIMEDKKRHILIGVDTFPFFHKKFKDYIGEKNPKANILEIKFFDIVIPEESRENLLEDLKTFEFGNFKFMQDNIVSKILRKSMPFQFIDNSKYTLNIDEKKKILDEGWWVYAQPIMELIDGRNKRFEYI